MLFGNPDTFAIWFDSVESWSTDRFQNGCFAYFLDGKLLWSLASTLGVDINLLSALHCIKGNVEDNRLFHLPYAQAYAELCSRAFPAMDSDAALSDYRHLVSVGSLLDEGHYIFIVESKEEAKLIYGFKDTSSVSEIILKRGEFQCVVLDAVGKFQDSKK